MRHLSVHSVISVTTVTNALAALAALAAFQHRCGFLEGGQTLPWPPSTLPHLSDHHTAPPAPLPDPHTGLTIASTARVTIVNAVTNVTNALILLLLLVLLTPVLGKRAPRLWSSCSPWPSFSP